MRLYSGLVFGFVFASTVLAHSAERSQPFAGDGGYKDYASFRAGVGLRDVSNTFQFITATTTLPMLVGDPKDGINIYVGFDGGACSNVSLRVGVLGQIDNNYKPQYTPYLRWYPGEIEAFENFTASVGDHIALTVSAFNSTSGNVAVWNGDKADFASEELLSAYSLCRADAMWMVEPVYYPKSGAFYPLPLFPNVSFEDAFVFAQDKILSPTDNPEVYNIVELPENGPLTSVQITNASVTVARNWG